MAVAERQHLFQWKEGLHVHDTTLPDEDVINQSYPEQELFASNIRWQLQDNCSHSIAMQDLTWREVMVEAQIQTSFPGFLAQTHALQQY